MKRPTRVAVLCVAIGTLLGLDETSRAETVRMLRDLNTSPETRAPGGFAHSPSLGLSFFTAESGMKGSELWKTDGTVNGTLLVKDIRPGPESSEIAFLADVDGTVYFIANDGTHGLELWKTDGTAAGTVLVKDINPTGNGAVRLGDRQAVDGTLYFPANDGTHGEELWKSDGSENGTVLVKDINPAELSSSPHSLVILSGGLCFLVGSDGDTLWKTDGSENGTVLVKEVSVHWPVLVDGTLYFSSGAINYGEELWKSNGTTAGTTMVKDINPGTDGSYPQNLYNATGTLYFAAYDGHEGKLFRSNGTGAGTVAINPSDPLEALSARFLGTVNGKVIFTSSDYTIGSEPWVTDGTDAGTKLLKDIAPGLGESDIPLESGLVSMTDLNGSLLFSAFDADRGRELWRTDGTEAGTVLVKDIRAGTTGSNPASFRLVTPPSGPAKLVFWANAGSPGNEPWVSDGTAVGTTLLEDVLPGDRSTTPVSLGDAGGKLLLSFWSGSQFELWISDATPEGTMKLRRFESGRTESSDVHSQVDAGGELYFWGNQKLWKSDGTDLGTRFVYDVDKTGFDFPATLANGILYFVNQPPSVQSPAWLWRSDGTAAGTGPIQNLGGSGFYGQPDGQAAHPTSLNGSMFYVHDYSDYATGQYPSELWRSDGTTPGTALVKGFNAMPPKKIADLHAAGGSLHFIVQWPGAQELWRSDGTENGTTLIHGTYTTGSNLFPNLFNVGGKVGFNLDDGTHGIEPWTSDLATGVTTLLKDIATGPESSGLGGVYNANGLAYFAARNADSGRELWRTNGTPAGTVMLKDINPGQGDSFPDRLHQVGATVFFSASDGIHSSALWKTNGTPQGTVLVKDVDPDNHRDQLESFADVGGTLFFVHSDYTPIAASITSELWKSDGTSAGTTLVKPLSPAWFSCTKQIAPFDGSMFFVAWDEASGCELWKSDSTGANLVKFELWPGPEPNSSGPADFFQSGGSLYFTASDGVHGRELWSVSNLPAPQPTPTPIGGTVVRNGTVTDGKPATETVSVPPGAAYLRIAFSLVFESRGSCSAQITIQRPASALLGPYELSADPTMLDLRGIAGDWVFEITSSGGCSAQPYQLVIASVGPFAGVRTSLLGFGVLVVTLGCLMTFGRQRGRSCRG